MCSCSDFTGVSSCLLNISERVRTRTIGGLTGSRVAGALGHVPVCDVALAFEVSWRKSGWKPATGSRICLCTWVDNLYSYSSCVRGSVRILEDIEFHISSKWGLSDKTNSLSVLVCRGCHDLVIKVCGWPVHDTMNVLGHIVQNDAGILCNWLSTEAKMWGVLGLMLAASVPSN